MVTEEIQARLQALGDPVYRQFQSKLIPGYPAEDIIGVRLPQIRSLAKEFAAHPQIEEFLRALPHKYYDEYNLHGAILCLEKDYDRAVARLEAFLPFVDNWATCDLLRPKAFRKGGERLIADIDRWMASGETYTVRFGMEMLMTFFLDERFRPEYLKMVADIHSQEYYVNMMIAWFFATALAKQWDAAIVYLQQRLLSEWVHAKTIRKAIESFRITPEQKAYLRTLR